MSNTWITPIAFNWGWMQAALSKHYENPKLEAPGSAMKYTFSGHDYRTWYVEGFAEPGEGLLLTHKIDHVRGLSTDDHCSLMFYLDPQGTLLRAAAIIEMKDEKPVSSGVIKGGDVPTGLSDALFNCPAFLEHYDDSNGGRQKFPLVIADNLRLAITCIEQAKVTQIPGG